MKKYKYDARSANNRRVKGVILAENEIDLSVLLQEKGLFLVSCKEIKQDNKKQFSLSGRVSPSEIALFCRQFSIMINSGVPVAECLATLSSQSFSGEFRRIITSVYENVLAGKSLDEAFAMYPQTFQPYFISMVKLGSDGGVLPDVMNNCASYFENEEKVNKKLTSAIAYPAFLLVLLAVVCVCVVGFVIPTFKDAVTELGIEDVPRITEAVFAVGGYLQTNIGIILLIAIGVIALLIAFSLTGRGRMLIDKAKLKLPLVRSVSVNVICARFSRSVGLLLANGTDILEAFESGAQIIKNTYARKRIYEAVEDLKKGKSAVSALRSADIFPEIFIQMVSVGEKSGSLKDVMEKCTSYFESRTEISVNRLLSVIQPVLLIVVGIIVAVVFVSVYSPIMGLMNGI